MSNQYLNDKCEDGILEKNSRRILSFIYEEISSKLFESLSGEISEGVWRNFPKGILRGISRRISNKYR